MIKNGVLHHIEIYVDDLAITKEFWGWLLYRLDYEIHQEWEDGMSFKKHDTYIVFVQTQAKYKNHPYHRCHSGLNHLAFHASRDLIDSIKKELHDREVTILYEDRHPYAAGEQSYALFFEDPMRMKVELCAY